MFFFFKQKTAYEIYQCDWSSDVCSSDLVDSAEGVKGTAQIMEWARDLGRKRGDLFEIAIWRDGVHVVGDTLYYYQAIHQESDVIPENIDCIRAMCNLETDKLKSIETTDRAMGIISGEM